MGGLRTRLTGVPSSARPVAKAEHFGAVHAVAISPDQRLIVTGAADRVAILWSLEHGTPQVGERKGRRRDTSQTEWTSGHFVTEVTTRWPP